MTARDDEAFAAFVAARSGPLLATAYALTRDRQLAEDLLQTALARCYVAWPRIRSEDPDAYVRQALINAQRNWWRRRMPVLVWRAEVPDRQQVRPFDDQVVDRRALLDAVASLSRQQRTVLVLRYFEDLTDPQIAKLMGCSMGSVKRHANRALRRLKQDTSLRDTGPGASLRHRVVS